MKKLAIPSVALAAALTLAACSSSTDESAAQSPTSATSASAPASPPVDNASRTVLEVLSTAEGFGIFTKAVKAAGLTSVLEGEGPITVFAPADPAFTSLPPGVLDALLEPANKEVLAKVLKYHIVAQEITTENVKEEDVATLEGQTVRLSPEDNLTVNEQAAVQGDVMASNGVAHAFLTVLIPPDVDVNALVSK